jgi:hypothetical protein
MTEIKKFEFIDFTQKEVTQQENAEIKVNHIPIDIPIEQSLEEFIDQNSLEDIGQPLAPVQELNLIHITQEEFDQIIADREEKAIANYIKNQTPIINDINNNDILLTKISQLVKEIKNRVDIELEGLLDKLLQLSYNIAAKVIDIHLMNIKEKDFIELIKQKIESLGFNNSIKVELNNEQIAEVLKINGVEVLINNDMLELDYKIVWCNGFMQKKSSDIISQIEEILIKNTK